MTAVNMLIALAAPSDGGSAARAGGEQSALFDGALAQAGRLLDAAAGESAAGAGNGDGGVHHSGVDATGDAPDGAADDDAMAGAVATAGSVMVAALGALLPSAQGQRETATVAAGAAASGDDASVAPGSPAALADGRPDGAAVPAAAPSPAGSPAPSATSSATASPPYAPAAQTTPAAPAASDVPAAQTGAATAALRVDASAVSGGASSTQSTMPLPSTAAATVEQAQGITTPASPTTTAAASAPSALGPQDGMSVRVRTAPASAPPAPTSATGADVDGGAGISPSSAVVPSSPVEVPAAATGSARQPIAAQVAPVLVSIVQRPVGTHRLTLTVNPESLGPVTVTAHIGRAGDVRVEIVGATEVGREALRAIVADLRRDLAAVMPHASLSVGSGASSGADAAPDRGHGAPGGPAGESARGGSGAESHDRPSARQAPARPLDLASGIRPSARAGSGEGLDTFA